MQGFSKKYSKGILACIASIFFVLFGCQIADASAQSSNQTVKAGIFYFDGYHMKDEEDNLTGYGIEVLNLISEYSHLSFQYVGYDKSWNDMLSMLEDGQIDVVTSARKSVERNRKFAFSLPIGISQTILSVQNDNTTFRRGDYKTYDGMTVGMIRGRSQNQRFREFAKKHNFKFRAKMYKDTDALARALQDGTVDAALSSDLRKAENEKTLDTITTENFYAIVRKEDTELLDELNYAIEQMNVNEGDWVNKLLYKYYGPVYSSALEFNKREQAYIKDVISGKKKITATSIGDRKPYSYVEDGILTGIQVDYFSMIMEMAGLPYEMVTPKDRGDYNDITDNNEVDVVIDKRNSDAAMKNDQKGFQRRNQDSCRCTGPGKYPGRVGAGRRCNN